MPFGIWKDDISVNETVFLSLLTILVISRFLKYYNGLQVVAHIPGYRPPFGPLDFPGVALPTRWWNTGLDVHYRRRHDMYKEREYTSLVPFITGAPQIWTNNLDVAKQIEGGGYKGVFFKPPQSSRALRLWGPNLAASNGEQWRKHRRVMGPAFNQKLYRTVWKKTQEIYREMVLSPEWSNEVVQLRPVQSMTFKLALVILGTCGFGLPGTWSEPPKTQSDDSKAMTVQGALRIVADTIVLTLFAPGWFKKLPIKRIQESQNAYRQLSDFMQNQTELRKSLINGQNSPQTDISDDGVGKNNLLNLLVQANEDEEGKYRLDDEELIGNVFLLLLAGHETTANALAGTFGFLAANAKIQQEIYESVIEVIGLERNPDFEDYNKLNKVMCAFIETVRLIPGGHLLIREAGEDTIIDIPADPKSGSPKESLPVKKGAKVIVDMIGLHRNPRYFEDPEEYRPSRWYNVPNDSELFTGFSVGPRACIGRKFASVEAVCWLTMVLRDWEVQPFLREGESVQEWNERTLVPSFSLTLGVGDVPVRFVRRQRATI
ncbi:cytochrome P450 [Marasmius fiardii PR-910]|nr:cytochrome P450 [Marasmius fiardii PR-910]